MRQDISTITIAGEDFLAVFQSVFGKLSKTLIYTFFPVLFSTALAEGGDQSGLLSIRNDVIRFFPPASDDYAPEPVLEKLGHKLFNDPGLSGDGRYSCATCHNVAMGGADSRALSRPESNMNTLALNHVRTAQILYWNGRLSDLSKQIDEAISSLDEMAGQWNDAVESVKSNPDYPHLFRDAFGDAEINRARITRAIVTYEWSLGSLNSRFDRFLSGQLDQLDEDEIEGLSLFINYGCVACHQGVNIGGNVYQKLGVVEGLRGMDATEREHDRNDLTGRPEDKWRFRVPSLRNVALTAPYLHDGRVDELATVVTLMFRHQLGRIPEDREVLLILKFLSTLTSVAKQPSETGSPR